MTTRILPPAEYGRLVGTELEAVAPHLPAGAQVIAVEDGDRLVGCWALLPLWHAEGVWIHPDYRGRGSVAWRLVVAMRRIATGLGAKAVWTSALTETVAALARKVGGTEIPGHHFLLCVDANGGDTIDTELAPCQQR